MSLRSSNASVSSVELPHGAIHLWYAALDQEVSHLPLLFKALSADERMRADRFHFEKDRRHFILCRGILRVILGCYLTVDPTGLCFTYGAKGKPALVDDGGNGTIYFNLSHSGGMALYAFTREGEIGVDIEHVHTMPDMDRVSERFFSARELTAFRSVPPGLKQEAFYACWTRKEAFIKALGEGLSFPPDRFEISLTPGEPARLRWLDGNVSAASDWTIRQLTIAEGFSAAFAIHKRTVHYQCRQWDGNLARHHACYRRQPELPGILLEQVKPQQPLCASPG